MSGCQHRMQFNRECYFTAHGYRAHELRLSWLNQAFYCLVRWSSFSLSIFNPTPSDTSAAASVTGFPPWKCHPLPSPVCSVNSSPPPREAQAHHFLRRCHRVLKTAWGTPSLASSNILQHLTHVLLIISHLLPTRPRLRPCLTACSQQLIHGWTDM